MFSLTEPLSILGGVSLAAVAVTGLFWIFRQVSDKWLASQFQKNLELFRHEQQQELEQLRYKINALMDRTIKLHQMEFVSLPEIWARLNDAFNHAVSFVSFMQTHADLDQMGEAQLNEFLDKCGLADWQKAELRDGSDKGRRFFKFKFWHDLHRAKTRYWRFESYFVKKGIFIQSDLKALIAELSSLMAEALNEREFEEQHPSSREGRFEKCRLFLGTGNERLTLIGDAVQNRLWSENALAHSPPKLAPTPAPC